ncbi:MAG: hypothetical protein Q7R70_06400 [Candidatus Diapherotrites archaeon]|nr:hypothetical protein [Candidatus Diapherotrites archaeon]
MPQQNWPNRKTDSIMTMVVNSFLKSGKTIIFVDGIDASGKTYFARNLKKSLYSKAIKSTQLRVDDFLKTETKRIRNGKSSWKAYYSQWFDFITIKKILTTFIQKGKLEKESLIFNNKTKKKKEKIQVKKESILIVEGVFLSKKEFSKIPAFRIFLDIPFSCSFERQLKREPIVRKISRKEVIFRWNHWHKPAQQWYLRKNHPKKAANLVINNANYNHPKLIKVNA